MPPDLEDMWRNGCPKSPEWIGSGPTSEVDCGFEFCEHNVENMAIEVIGQDRSREVISLFVEDREVGRVALSWDVCKGSSESLRRALSSFAGWPVSFEILVLDMVCLWNEGVPSIPLCPFVVFCSSESRASQNPVKTRCRDILMVGW